MQRRVNITENPLMSLSEDLLKLIQGESKCIKNKATKYFLRMVVYQHKSILIE